MLESFLSSASFTTLAIGSSIFAAIANILARTLLKDLRSQDILGINFLTMGIVLALFSPAFYYFQATEIAMVLLVGLSFLDAVANFFYFKTFEHTEASVATPILSIAPGFTFFFGWVLLGEIVDLRTSLLVISIILLVVFITADFQDFKKFQSKTLLPALIASCLFGVSAIPTKVLLHSLNVINAPTLYMFRCGWIALFALLLFNFNVSHLTTHQYRLIFGRGLFVIAQWILLYLALEVGHTGVSVTLGNITPVFVLLFSICFLREKFSIGKLICALLILAMSLAI